MRRRGDHEQYLNAIPLVNAVLCVDCDTISNSPHDKCLVCGSNSLFNLRRVLEGSLPQDSGLTQTVKYNLEITATVTGICGNDLSRTTESITRLLASNQTGGWESFHVNVEPVLEVDDKRAAMAA
jgi:hypothetical protein